VFVHRLVATVLLDVFEYRLVAAVLLNTVLNLRITFSFLFPCFLFKCQAKLCLAAAAA
jgi:hypothetical protein